MGREGVIRDVNVSVRPIRGIPILDADGRVGVTMKEEVPSTESPP